MLVHGLGGAASNWVVLAPLLARHRLLVPDLPGHGGSTPLPALPSLSALADRVWLVMERERIRRAAVVGHSMGGVVAMRLALRRPHAVSALVLAATAGISSATRRAEIALRILGLVRPGRVLARPEERVVRSRLLRQLVFGYWGAADPAALPDDAVRGFLDGTRRASDAPSAARALVLDDPRADLARLACPCLVLWGARDNQLPVGDAFDYARRLRAPLRTIADAGHLLIGERPDACAEAIESVLARDAVPRP